MAAKVQKYQRQLFHVCRRVKRGGREQEIEMGGENTQKREEDRNKSGKCDPKSCLLFFANGTRGVMG